MLLLRLKMEEEVQIIFTVFHQFLGLINLLDDDDNNNNLMLEIMRRRNDFLGRYLERQRVIQNRIHENRELYYSSYWYVVRQLS
jgi:hypothetical protein